MKTPTVAALAAHIVARLKTIKIRDHVDLIAVFNGLSPEEFEFLKHFEKTIGGHEFGIWFANLVVEAGKTEEIAVATSTGFDAKKAEVEAQLKVETAKLRKIEALQTKVERLQAELDSLHMDPGAGSSEYDKELDRLMEQTARTGMKN